MNKTLFILIIILGLFLFSCEKNKLKDKNVAYLTIPSVNTHQNYKINILLPDNYLPANSYPVVYLLDGYYWFKEIGNKAVNLMENHEISDIILVSIAYQDYPLNLSNLDKIDELRTNDLTYPVNSINGNIEGGKGIAFYNFIKSELIPQIENKYSIDSNNRAIFGHSLAGYFSLFQMINFENDALFKNVVAISPSLWWSESNLLKIEQQLFDNKKDLPFNLYTSIGTLEGIEMNVLFSELSLKFKNHDYPNLNLKVENYPTGHNKSASIGFVNALKFLYK